MSIKIGCVLNGGALHYNIAMQTNTLRIAAAVAIATTMLSFTVHAAPLDAKPFYAADKKYNIEAKLLYAVSKAESDMRMNCVSIYAPPRVVSAVAANIQSLGIRIGSDCRLAAKRGKKKVGCSMFPDSEEQARRLFTVLDAYVRNGSIHSYDIGAMQINSRNARKFKWDRVRLVRNLSYNVDKGGFLMRDCLNSTRHNYAAIECYNKGYKKRYSGTYLQRVIDAYAQVRMPPER